MTTTTIPTTRPEPTAKTTPTVVHDERTGAVSEDFADAKRERDANQSQSDMRSAFGEPIREGRSVRWSVDMRDRKNRGLLKEMTAPKRRVMIERSAKMNARAKVKLVDRQTGQVHYPLAEDADYLGRRRNLHQPMRARGLPVERGPDGMLFRCVAGRWEPTGRKCLGIPIDGSDPLDVQSAQVSPANELWIRDKDGEWRCYGPVDHDDEAVGQ